MPTRIENASSNSFGEFFTSNDSFGRGRREREAGRGRTKLCRVLFVRHRLRVHVVVDKQIFTRSREI